jgi:hypothetical protein
MPRGTGTIRRCLPKIYGACQAALGKTRVTKKLKPQAPWFGYNLGLWSDEDEAEAQAAVLGDHYETGGKRLQVSCALNQAECSKNRV